MTFKSPFFRSGFNYDTDAVSQETGLLCKDVSLAVQDQRDEVDINTIVARFGLTGQLPDQVSVPQSGDFTGVCDFQSAMNAILKAEADFMELPGALRARFSNDPQVLMDFCEDRANLDEARRLGLLKEVPVADPGIKLSKESIEGIALAFPGSRKGSE